MSHQVEPTQECRILTIQIAVPADVEESIISDEISALLTDLGVEEIDSNILDWRQVEKFDSAQIVTASEDPSEGEIFKMATKVSQKARKPVPVLVPVEV